DQYYVGPECDQFLCVFASEVGVGSADANLDPDVVAIGPSQFLQRVLKGASPYLEFLIARDGGCEEADPPRRSRLLRARHQRPRPCAADQSDKFTPPHARPQGPGGGIVSA